MSKFDGERMIVEFPSLENRELSPPVAFIFRLRVAAGISEVPLPFLAVFPASFVHVAVSPLLCVRRCLCR